MNYQQFETLTYERQAIFLAEAEQRRLTQYAIANPVHPVRAWIAQRFIALRHRASCGQAIPALPFTAQPAIR